ncbi:MAG: CBS domain-containing protein, partial [Alphaproteobacteria bacterium]|nr:CBS domain-containing protein [Alphaproteobacteria bacterium]
IMHAGDSMPLVRPDTLMAEALIEISSKAFGCVGVADGAGALLGIVTDGDLRRSMSIDLLQRPVSAIMTASPKTIRPRALVAEAVAVMNESQITALFVVEDGLPVGIIHVHDCLRAGIV